VVFVAFLLLGALALAIPPKDKAFAGTLSGTYLLHFEQTSKSCGPKIRPVEMEVGLEVSNGRMHVTAPPGFLGIKMLEADFDSQRNEIKTHAKKRIDLGPTQATLTLDLKGRFAKKGDKPEIRFELAFDKNADDPSWNCKVAGKGWAKKL
jgi:hypothetical protein